MQKPGDGDTGQRGSGHQEKRLAGDWVPGDWVPGDWVLGDWVLGDWVPGDWTVDEVTET